MYTITKATRHWRQYLLGRQFVIYTNHQSLHSLTHQIFQTPEQHKWLTKLLGFEYDIIYKPAHCNHPVDALLCLHGEEKPHLAALAVTRPLLALWQALQQAYKEDVLLTSLLEAIWKNHQVILIFQS